jgi:hypothetical protein
MNIISALGAYCFFDNKPKALSGYYNPQNEMFAERKTK